MKKIGLLVLTMVLALGALGVGYAKWSDTVVINGSVESGFVCVDTINWAEIGTFDGIPDENWTTWDPSPGTPSCPPDFAFGGIHPVDKDVGWVEFTPIYDGLDRVKALEVTIHNGYPYYLGMFQFSMCNCGTIPIKIDPRVVNQTFNGQPTDDILVQFDDGLYPPGTQLEPMDCTYVTFMVGIQQKAQQGQVGTYSFTILTGGVQWNEYP